MDRRTFIGSVAGGLLAVPLAARAQNSSIPVIGFLSGQSPGPWAPYVAAFRNGLSETGYIEGKNVAIEFRWAEGQYGRLPALAADLPVLQPTKFELVINTRTAKALGLTIPQSLRVQAELIE